MNIILDMDETLICSQINDYFHLPEPIPRPYLKNFFEYVFDKFINVSIWTHGTKEWYDIVYNKIFKFIIPKGKSFHFVRTRDDKYDYKDFIDPNIENKFLFSNIKPLQLIYNNYPNEYNENNTYILDDNPTTYIINSKNAIKIKPFYSIFTKNDIELLIIMNFIEYKFKYQNLQFDNFIKRIDTKINTNENISENISENRK
jgi:hypothetical protein